MSFVDYGPKWGLGEKISESLDVLEGALNIVCRTKKPKRGGNEKNVIIGNARRRIYEGLNDFHESAILHSNLTVTIAVFGVEGVGKSALFNFLLTQGVPQSDPNNLFSRLRDGPLPSGKGARQTRLPVYVTKGKQVRVVVHKEGKPEVWYPDNGQRNTLSIVQSTEQVREYIERNFARWEQEEASYIELQGPFTILQDLGERRTTSSGHLELLVDVQLLDLPGLRGDEKGDKILTSELNKADIILFFTSGQQGRGVKSNDLADIFRQHGQFDASSRPSLVHVVKAEEFKDVERLRDENEKALLEDAWPVFFGDDESNKCYREAREKLPQLGGEELLTKLKDESKVLVFHPKDEGFLERLRDVINSHVENVVIKKSFHPSLKKVHKLAKELNKVISQSRAKAKEPEQIKMEPEQIKIGHRPPLGVSSDDKGEESVIDLFISSEEFTQLENLGRVFKGFLYKFETIEFIKKRLEVSLKDFSERLITLFENNYNSKSISIASGLKEVVDVFCQSKIELFSANRFKPLYSSIVKKRTPTNDQEKKWRNSTEEMRETTLRDYLKDLIHEVLGRLLRERGKEADSSPSKVSDSLMVRVQDLLAITSLESKPDISKIPLKKVIDFSREAIRKYNPHFDLSTLDSYDHTKAFPEEMKMRSHDVLKIATKSSPEQIVKDMEQQLSSGRDDLIRELEKKLKLEKRSLDPPRTNLKVDEGKWLSVLLTVLSDQDHFDVSLDDKFKLDEKSEASLLNFARKRLFAFQKSRVKCEIEVTNSFPEREIHVEKHKEFQNVLAVSMSTSTRKLIDDICTSFTSCQVQLAPIFIPTIRPGPERSRTGNYFLEENPWDASEDETPIEENFEGKLKFNIFLVVEKQHLKKIKSTIHKKTLPSDREINLTYVVLPGNGHGIGVSRAVIKSLAECFKFDLYWTIDDDIKFMYQFNEDDRKWHKCTFARGLLFGQRVFHHCRQTTFKQPSQDAMDDLRDQTQALWPDQAKTSQTFREARRLLSDDTIKKVRDSPGLLHSPFTTENISKDCEGGNIGSDELSEIEKKFVESCRSLLFSEEVNRIAGVSIAHKASQRFDIIGVHPSAHFMPSKQRYQVVLHNTCALKEVNYVTDDMIFHEGENQVKDPNCRNTPYWGIRHSDKSFCRALEVKGVTGFQVICVNHEHEKDLINVFQRIGHSYEDSNSPYGSDNQNYA